MSADTLDVARFAAILKQAATDFKGRAEELRQLDSILGDGDLGVTIELTSKAMLEYLTTQQEDDIGKLLMNCGLNINKISPSTFGTVLANAFMGAGKAAFGKKQIEIIDLAALGDGAIESIKKRGKAEVGDKTVVDTLVPAVEAFKKESASGDAKAALSATVKAAEAGMKATADMKAKFGRAKWFQDKSIGVQDGGATAMYYLIESFVRHLNPPA
ncbi:MAG: dihydroxyacetone kinase subunit L [Dehalococcoidales bacterium]|nr:dihydroxyacetone kinase subunit L [Dehalococcoidales bacterium]